VTTTQPPIEVHCRLFARYAELVGTDRTTLRLLPAATVADAVRELRERLPGGKALPERPLVAVNQAHARATQPLADGDELALLPPLAGG
jgi:molybdopterin converting factor small subunit